MDRRLTWVIFLPLFCTLGACAGSHSSSSGQQTSFTDETGTPSAPAATPPAEKSELPAYVVPAKIRESLAKKYPHVVPKTDPTFTVANQDMRVDGGAATMTFSGVLKITGKADEKIELRCQYDVRQTPWTCDKMYPTDLKVAAQMRLQGTSTCIGFNWDPKSQSYRCEIMGVKLYVVIDGKTQSQLFQRQPFQIWRAGSGDELEESADNKPAPAPTQLTPPPSPTPSTQPAIPPPKLMPSDEDLPGQALSDEEAIKALNDANSSVEITAPVPVPAPAKGQYSIPGIERQSPKIGPDVKEQAIGRHDRGALRDGAQLPAQAEGIEARKNDKNHWGTDLMIGMLQTTARDMHKNFSKSPDLVVANIAAHFGGPISAKHTSHQTGLDADVIFPSVRPVHDMFSACTKLNGSTCARGSAISENFDEARFWFMIKDFTCAKNKPVIAMFLDREIKQHMCEYARKTGEDLSPGSCAFRALQALKHWEGHYHHVHIRLRCPGNHYCMNAAVTLANETGCN